MAKRTKKPVIFTLHFRKVSFNNLTFSIKFIGPRLMRKMWRTIIKDIFRLVYPDVLVKWSLSHPMIRGVVAPSSYIQSYLKRLLPAKNIIFIPSSINPVFWNFYSAAHNFRENCKLGDRPIIFYYGALSPERGVHIFFSCVPLIKKKVPNAFFLALIRKLGEEDKHWSAHFDVTNFIGEEEKTSIRIIQSEVRDVRYFLAAADIVVLPFLPLYPVEFPLTVLEAMAMQKPIVTTSHIIKDGETGIRVQEPTPENIADAIFGLIKDRERMRELGKNARNDILNHYDPSLILGKTLAFYRECVNKP